MKKTAILFLLSFMWALSHSQNTAQLIAEVSLDSLVKTVREFSGEDSTRVLDSLVRIKHRVSTLGNNLAADYLFEKLKGHGFAVEQQNYRPGGRNIIATLKGKVNPDSIYIISAHYDAVADYCADDNASGTSVVLEAARIMSKYYFNNTVIFALWDEEELGLVGSHYYADTAFSHNKKILGVINMDMLGYDSDNNKVFDIHTNSNLKNQALKDTLLFVLDSFNISLIPNVLNPGTDASDHGSFWKKNYPAIIFGESFFGGDPNPSYHRATDRINLFNLSYFHKLAKLAIGTITELAGIIPTIRHVDSLFACGDYNYSGRMFAVSGIYHDTLKNALGCDSIYTMDLSIIRLSDSVIRNGRMFTAFESGANYRWLDCGNALKELSNENQQSFVVKQDGSFAVEVSKKTCKDTSDCFELMISNAEQIQLPVSFKVYPNPTDGKVMIDLGDKQEVVLVELYSSSGQLLSSQSHLNKSEILLEINEGQGLYILQIISDKGSDIFKILRN